jgi:hypothetical protein
MLKTNQSPIHSLLVVAAALCALLVYLLAPMPGEACSITSGGSCGGDPCDDGETCKKVSDTECKCVKDRGDLPECDAGEKHCQIGASEWMCWPADEPCPDPGARSEEVSSACLVVFSSPGAAVAESRGTQEVTLAVSGCSGCFKSALVKLPGNVIDVAHMGSDFSGAVNSSGIYWLGDTVWESTCFGNSSGKCGSVRRTYLIAY